MSVDVSKRDEVLSGTAPLETSSFRAFRLSVLVPVYNERHVAEASIRRVLALSHPLIRELEVIIVDDCSNDGTSEVLVRLAADDSRIHLIRHEQNRGKGAAVRTAIDAATGEICLIQDADFEYNPADIPSLLVPFAEEGADAVFGSRYLSASYRRALMYRHTLMNKGLTALSNWFTDLHLTDMETGYKAINTALLKSIPIRSNDFRFEVEITFKLAKRGARIFEVPIRYLPRTRAEGKKIGAKDGFRALFAMLHWWLIDDVYQQDQHGTGLLSELEKARRLTLWLGDSIRPYVGDSVLEVSAGVAGITNQLIPRDLYIVAESNPHYLRFLQSYSLGKPYIRIAEFDPAREESYRAMGQRFDTVLMLNTLENVPDPEAALTWVWNCLKPEGRVIVQVPQRGSRFSAIDQQLGRRKRFEADELTFMLSRSGFRSPVILDFNRLAVPGWLINKVFHAKRFSRLQLKLFDTLVLFFRHFEWVWPWRGLSLIGIAVKDQ